MNRTRIDLNNEHSVGLGDNLCVLSALANLPVGVDLHVNNKHNTYDRLMLYKKIFRIPDQLLSITESNREGNFNNVGWPVKFFSEYYRPGYVNVRGQTIKLNDISRDKKCIAIASFSASKSDQADQWPYCRARPVEYWARLFAWLKKMNYDVITVDFAYHDLEDKIELLAKHCKAIISYEGGMAHLAHMLHLPCFIVNWTLPSPSTTLGEFHCEFVHRTNSAYILRYDEELLGWSEDEFNQKINDLREGKTNNRLLNGSCTVEFQGNMLGGDITVKDQLGRTMLTAPPIFGSNNVSKILSSFYKV